MYSISMSLVWLFDRMSGEGEVIVPCCGGGDGQLDLFGETEKNDGRFPGVNEVDIAVVAMIHQDAVVDFSILPENARHLFRVPQKDQAGRRRRPGRERLFHLPRPYGQITKQGSC